MNIAIIGGGNLGLSIARGLLLSKNSQSNKLIVTKRNVSSIEDIEHPSVKIISNNIEAVRNSNLVLLAVKPFDMAIVLKEISEILDPDKHLVIHLPLEYPLNN